jgi:TRAP-type C4-dicarboxylate transport system substrate-binding protein
MTANQPRYRSTPGWRTLSVIGVGTVLAASLTACGGSSDSGGGGGETIKIRYASYEGENTPVTKEVKWWMDSVTERVEKETDSKIDFELFLDASLLGPDEMLKGIQDGRADMSFLVTFAYPGEFPLNQLASVPFLATDSFAAREAWRSLAVDNDDVKAEWDRNGVVPVVWGAAGNTAAGLRKPVTSLDDLKGLRVRAIGVQAGAWKGVGAEPVAIPATDVYESMDRGVIDGWGSMPLETAAGNYRLDEVSPYIVDPGLGQFVNAATGAMSAKTWEKLPEDVQNIMREESDRLVETASADIMQGESDRICDNVAESGAEIQVLPEDLVTQWRDETFDSLLDGWKSEATKSGLSEDAVDAVLDEYTTLESENEGKSGYVDTLHYCLEKQG